MTDEGPKRTGAWGSRNPIWVAVAGLLLAIAGTWGAARVQGANGVAVRDIRFAGADGTAMSALLYVPRTATAATPAPGILAVHGYYNSRETQDGFAIEFARRGYVVLAIDQTGHGYSGGRVFQNGLGGPDGLRYLRSLPFVDKANIGLEGHSMGGWTILRAAKAMPDGYKAAILVGSSAGPPFSPPGSLQFPRNVALIFGRYDEFAPTMWGARSAFELGSAPRVMAMFGTDRPVEPDRLYGSIAAGTARLYHAPHVTHAWEHFSPTVIGQAVDWFGRTLAGGRPRSDQAWQAKEALTLLALIGFLTFVLGIASLLLRQRAFATLNDPPSTILSPARASRWRALAVPVVATAILYLPLMHLGAFIPNFEPFEQSFTTQIALWGLLQSALLFVIARRSSPQGRIVERDRIGTSLAFGAIVAGAAYLLVAATAALFTVDYRFWIVGLKPLDLRRAGQFVAYLPAYVLLFLLMLGPLQRIALNGLAGWRSYAASALALCGGFVIMLVPEYATLAWRGTLLTPGDGLYTILGLQFIPVLAAVALLSTFLFRRTARIWPGAFLCACLVTWYVTAGQAIQGIGPPPIG